MFEKIHINKYRLRKDDPRICNNFSLMGTKLHGIASSKKKYFRSTEASFSAKKNKSGKQMQFFVLSRFNELTVFNCDIYVTKN